MFWPGLRVSIRSALYNLNKCVRIKMLDTYYSGSSTSDRYTCMPVIYILYDFGVFFSCKVRVRYMGTWKACLWSTYVANLRGEYTCTCVVFFFFFFFLFFRTGHLQCYTREHGPRLGEIVFDREPSGCDSDCGSQATAGIEAELTEHQSDTDFRGC